MTTQAQWIGAALAELSALRAERDALRAALERIAEMDPAIDSEKGYNEWGEADCFGQARKLARAALAHKGE